MQLFIELKARFERMSKRTPCVIQIEHDCASPKLFQRGEFCDLNLGIIIFSPSSVVQKRVKDNLLIQLPFERIQSNKVAVK